MVEEVEEEEEEVANIGARRPNLEIVLDGV